MEARGYLPARSSETEFAGESLPDFTLLAVNVSCTDRWRLLEHEDHWKVVGCCTRFGGLLAVGTG